MDHAVYEKLTTTDDWKATCPKCHVIHTKDAFACPNCAGPLFILCVGGSWHYKAPKEKIQLRSTVLRFTCVNQLCKFEDDSQDCPTCDATLSIASVRAIGRFRSEKIKKLWDKRTGNVNAFCGYAWLLTVLGSGVAFWEFHRRGGTFDSGSPFRHIGAIFAGLFTGCWFGLFVWSIPAIIVGKLRAISLESYRKSKDFEVELIEVSHGDTFDADRFI